MSQDSAKIQICDINDKATCSVSTCGSCPNKESRLQHSCELWCKKKKCTTLQKITVHENHNEHSPDHKPTYTELRNSFNQNPVRVWLGVIFSHHLLAHLPRCPCLINSHSFGCRILVIVHLNHQFLHPGSPKFLQSYPYLFSFDPLVSLLLYMTEINPSCLMSKKCKFP